MYEIGAAAVSQSNGVARISGTLVDLTDKTAFCVRLPLSGLLTSVAVARSRFDADTTALSVSLFDEVDALVWRGNSIADQAQIDQAPVLPDGISVVPLIGFYWLSVECTSLSTAGYTVDVELTTCPAFG